MKAPRCAFDVNISGKKVAAGTPPSELVDFMKKQLANEILGEPTIKQMIMDLEPSVGVDACFLEGMSF